MTDDPEKLDETAPEDDHEEVDNSAKRVASSARKGVARAWRWVVSAPKRATSRGWKWVTKTHPRQWAGLLLLAGLVEAVAVLALRFGVQRGFKLDWGNVPTWVGANLTAAAVALALLSSVTDRRDREQERLREQAERRERDKNQARLVFVRAADRAVLVTNFSDKPVFRLRVKVRLSGVAGVLQTFRELSSGVPTGSAPADFSVLVAGKTRQFDVAGAPSARELADSAARTDVQRWIDAATGTGTGRGLPTVQLRFTDAQGNQWECVHRLDDSAEPTVRRLA